MVCLVHLYTSTPLWLNLDVIKTISIAASRTGWEVDYYGPPLSPKDMGMMASEKYPTKTDAYARMKFIEKMVNTKCGTTTFRIKKLK